jgi:5-methylcytosine-specific restriction protein B
MTYKAKINNIEVTYKNRTVLEIVKQYINNSKDITYGNLKEIFYNDLQGSIGVLKNEKELIAWETKEENKKDTRENRFFTKSSDIISLNGENIYVCTQWGDGNNNIKPNFMPFIKYARVKLGFNIEDNSYEMGLVKKNTKKKEFQNEKKQPLNQILYGPPGTGKTYHTIDKALQIIDAKVPESREEAKERFEELKEAGQIEFVTFHQSYGYEEFVEGIKADVESETIRYIIEDGIFKSLSDKARRHFEDSQKSQSEIASEISKKDKMSEFLNKALEEEKIFQKTKGGKFGIKDLTEKFIILYSEDSNYNENSITLDIEEFYKIINSNIEFKTSRQIAQEVFGISNQRQKDTYYLSLYKEYAKLPYVAVRLNREMAEKKNYLLIIDEINRGNISKIFGELITLIEESKRLGNDEAMEVTLPYSGEKFGVPKNLYIIGTMNTADRSIALMDTALRRRFEFEEMMPKSELLGNIKDIDLKQLLVTINNRIEYLYDRDHTIGHAYFMGVEDKSTLDSVMRNKVIPLLQEYFYDDWEKIRLVLNEGFIVRDKQEADKLFDIVIDDEYNEDGKYTYSIASDFNEDAYRKIYAKIEQN